MDCPRCKGPLRKVVEGCPNCGWSVDDLFESYLDFLGDRKASGDPVKPMAFSILGALILATDLGLLEAKDSDKWRERLQDVGELEDLPFGISGQLRGWWGATGE